MKDGPFKTAVEASTINAFKQELITYYEDGEGNFCKEIATRKFFKDDYIDSTTSEVICPNKF